MTVAPGSKLNVPAYKINILIIITDNLIRHVPTLVFEVDPKPNKSLAIFNTHTQTQTHTHRQTLSIGKA